MTSSATTHEEIASRVTRLFEEQVRARPKARRAGDVLPSVDAITVEWLNDVLADVRGPARVAAFRVEDVSAGTHARHRVHLEWEPPGEALEGTLKDLDGFFTFVTGTRNGFGVVRDPIACKPAVMAETDDYVAFASEYRAFVNLPGIDTARVWEPEPATVYFWER